MPWKIDPKEGGEDVGYIYTTIARSLSILLPIGTLIITVIWGKYNGFDHFL
tara:strand:- start:201 stop:353 length:153 start_codon:yes stop_codon:yes gene_type:complete